MDYSKKPFQNIVNFNKNIWSKLKIKHTAVKVEPRVTAADSTGIENESGILIQYSVKIIF